MLMKDGFMGMGIRCLLGGVVLASVPAMAFNDVPLKPVVETTPATTGDVEDPATTPVPAEDAPAAAIAPSRKDGQAPAPAANDSEPTTVNARTGLTDAALPPAPMTLAPIFDGDTGRISFQALLTDNLGDPLPGPTADLVFNIYQSGGALVEGPIALAAQPINNGIVDIMLPVDAASFDGSGREIGVIVNGGAELAPRIPVGAVPHAFRVNRVASEELDDAIELGTNSDVGSMIIWAADGTRAMNLDGQRYNLDIFAANNNNTLRVRALGGNEATVSVYDPTGDPTALMDGEFGEIIAETWVQVTDNLINGVIHGSLESRTWGGQLITRDENGTSTVRIGSTSNSIQGGPGIGGFASFYNEIGGVTVFIDGEDGNAGGVVDVRDDTLNTTVELNGTQHRVSTYGSDGLEQTRIGGTSWGVLQLRDNSPSNDMTVQINAGSDLGGEVNLWDNTGGTRGVRLRGGTNSGGIVNVYNDNNQSTVTIDGDTGGDAASLVMSDATIDKIDLNAENASITLSSNTNDNIVLNGDTNRVSLFDGATESLRLVGSGGDGGGGISIFNDAGQQTVELDGSEGDHGVIRVSRSTGTATIEMLAAENASQGGSLRMYDANGNLTIELDAEFGGRGRIFTDELQINGADLAENFDINADNVVPGTVVSIDPNDPGKLVVSNSAYDRTVAGIVSGAGGVKPGMYMGQRGTIANGEHPIALTGRVFCLVDESNGTIEPGDLLTTSPTAGRAMKVTDHAAAQGAIIGKAMSRSKDGMVLVLVSLQ